MKRCMMVVSVPCLALALGATVRFVNDEVQVIRLILDGVIQRFPDGILRSSECCVSLPLRLIFWVFKK